MYKLTGKSIGLHMQKHARPNAAATALNGHRVFAELGGQKFEATSIPFFALNSGMGLRSVCTVVFAINY